MGAKVGDNFESGREAVGAAHPNPNQQTFREVRMAPTDRTPGFREIDIVQQHIKAAAEWHAQGEYASLTEYIEHTIDAGHHWGPSLESPLEALFWIWWKAATAGSNGGQFHLETQQHAEVAGVRYRLDFVVKLTGCDINDLVDSGKYRWPLLAVELDGHSFHEKTREQVAYRNQRDRLLQDAGWTVFHYSWTEMTERPAECAVEVLLAARKRYWAMLAESSDQKRIAAGAADAR
jgi:hypothetical protein